MVGRVRKTPVCAQFRQMGVYIRAWLAVKLAYCRFFPESKRPAFRLMIFIYIFGQVFCTFGLYIVTFLGDSIVFIPFSSCFKSLFLVSGTFSLNL
jgi:hypothetical protein